MNQRRGMSDGFIIVSIIAIVIVIIAVLVLVFSTWGTIDAGHRGVVLSMGRVTGEIKGEGAYGKTPWVISVIEMNVQTQKEEVKTECASKDLQMVTAVVALNLNLVPEKCADVYQHIGVNYLKIVVAPAMQESIKAIVAQFTAEELISKRELVRQDIAHLLAEKLDPIGIQTGAINIVNFDFSHSFNAAIEAKVTAEQNALAAKNKLEQIKFEAEQKIAEARGKAEAMLVEAKAMVNSPQILQLRALEKWDGKMPLVVGAGSLPFIQIEPERTARANP